MARAKYFSPLRSPSVAPNHFCPASFVARAKNISPLHLPLLPCRQIAAPAAAYHQDTHKPLRIPNHPLVGAKYFSPGRRPLVARNRLTISAAHHLLHGRKIFRPYARNWYATSNAIFQISDHVYGLGARHGHKIFRPSNHRKSIHTATFGT